MERAACAVRYGRRRSRGVGRFGQNTPSLGADSRTSQSGVYRTRMVSEALVPDAPRESVTVSVTL